MYILNAIVSRCQAALTAAAAADAALQNGRSISAKQRPLMLYHNPVEIDFSKVYSIDRNRE